MVQDDKNNHKSKIKEHKGTKFHDDDAKHTSTRLRLITGSYEHNLLCLSLILEDHVQAFSPVFHFTPHTQSIRCVAASKRYLVSGSNDELIRIYDLQKRKELGTLLHHSGSIACLEFFESKWLLSGGGDGKIYVWRTKDWEALAELKGHKGSVNDLSIHPSGKVAISVGEDKTLRLWNLMTGRKASVLKLGKVGIKARWSNDGMSYVVGFERKISLYSNQGDMINTVDLESPLYHLDVIVHNDIEYIVSSHGNGKIVFRQLKLMLNKEDQDQKIAEFELQGHGTRVKDFSYYTSNDTMFLTSVSSDGNIVVWNLELRDQVAVYRCGDRLNCCIMISDDIEDADSMRKRQREVDSTLSADETDFSEPEQIPKIKKKKAKVTIEK